MKRLVAVLLCMTMAVSITACGNSGKQKITK